MLSLNKKKPSESDSEGLRGSVIFAEVYFQGVVHKLQDLLDILKTEIFLVQEIVELLA